MGEFKSMIFSCSGTVLTDEEKSFFRDERPWGFFLFSRNIKAPQQIRDLAASLREAVGSPLAPIFIDQEGGIVQRLRPPLAPNYPSPQEIGKLYSSCRTSASRAAYLLGRLSAFDLRRYDLSADAMPLLDVSIDKCQQFLGTRTWGHDPSLVTCLGRAAADGLLAGGVLPVIKHMPGLGRGCVDSHLSITISNASIKTLSGRDFRPFRSLRHLPVGLVAHIIYNSIDPNAPASVSPIVVEDIIRSKIGFQGLLMSDDISMKSLSGSLKQRASAVLAAGVDMVLYSTGEFSEMKEVASACVPLAGESKARAFRALNYVPAPDNSDEAVLRNEFSKLIGRTV